MAHILVLHGPNLNLLGTRQPHLYGQTSLAAINRQLQQEATQAGHTIACWQSNDEGALVAWLQQQGPQADILLLNAAAYTHTSIAIRDAILAVNIPVMEVHLSNIYQRESFRHQSYIADIAVGQVAGFGPHSYRLALQAACEWLRHHRAVGTAPDGQSY